MNSNIDFGGKLEEKEEPGVVFSAGQPLQNMSAVVLDPVEGLEFTNSD